MSLLHFSLNGQDLEHLALRAQHAPTLAETRTMARSAMGVFVEIAKQEAPKRTTRLAGSLGYQSKLFPNGIELRHRSGGASGPGVLYAKFVVDGTGIYHRGGAHSEWDVDKFQRFTVSGDEIVTMHTHHRGQQPSDFEERAAKRLAGHLPAIAATGGRRLVRYLKTGAQ